MKDLTLPWPPKPIHSHNSGSWRDRARAVSEYRFASAAIARSTCQPIQPPVVGHMIIRAPDRRLRDVLNWAHAAKPAIDGIVDAGVLPGDDWRTILSWTIEYVVDTDNPGITILFLGAGDGENDDDQRR